LYAGQHRPLGNAPLDAALDQLARQIACHKTVKPDELARFCTARGDGRRARSRSIVRRSVGASTTRDHLARGELIARSAEQQALVRH
jgi:hypothetical protein